MGGVTREESEARTRRDSNSVRLTSTDPTKRRRSDSKKHFSVMSWNRDECLNHIADKVAGRPLELDTITITNSPTNHIIIKPWNYLKASDFQTPGAYSP